MEMVVPPRLRLYARLLGTYRFPATIADAALPDCPIIWANARFFALTGFAPEAVIGRNCRFLQVPTTSAKARRRLRQAIAAREPADAILENATADGRRFLNHLLLRPFAADLLVGAQNDVTDWVGSADAADDVPTTALGTAGELRTDVVGQWVERMASAAR